MYFRPLKFLMAACVSIFAGSAFADLQGVRTPQGILKTAEGHGENCYNCRGLFLNGKQIMHDFSITIDAVYPSEGPTLLASVSVSNGGNCCPPTRYILDFNQKPFRLVRDHGFDKDISRSEHGVVFSQLDGESALGDPLMRVSEYDFSTGRVSELKSTPQYDTEPLASKKYPWDVLGDPTLRAPLVALLGPKSFLELRYHVTLSSPDMLSITSDGLIFGHGNMPHSAEDGGAFIIDTKRKLAWAVQSDDGKAVLWGVLKREDKVSQFLAGWLAENHVAASDVSFAPLSSTQKSLYSLATTPKGPDFDTRGHVLEAVSMTPSSIPLNTVQLFKTLSPSIFVVVAKMDGGDTLQGSAVAVSRNALLTNCHVVKDATGIVVSQNGVAQSATITSADFEHDRCVLMPNKNLSTFVSIRPYEELNIGERVFSIGAPAGLELTLADGLLSGKRTDDGRHLVQTTASISPGSSGGGLFDEFGNLIGITTFRLKDSENLNFAISAEDYIH
jgi:hypothetical protein